jgi:hypothetical protein
MGTKNSIFILILLLGIIACRSGAEDEQPAPEPTESAVTATINGIFWKADIQDVIIIDKEFVLNAQQLNQDGIPIRIINIQGPFARPGTYGIGGVNGNEVGYFENNESGDISRGALVVSRISERWVEGTFNFEGSIGRGANNRRVVVTNGKFAVKRN